MDRLIYTSLTAMRGAMARQTAFVRFFRGAPEARQDDEGDVEQVRRRARAPSPPPPPPRARDAEGSD